MSSTRALSFFVQVGIFGTCLVGPVNLSYAASASSQPASNASIAKPIEQVAKPAIQLPVESKGIPSKATPSSASSASVPRGEQAASKAVLTEQLPSLSTKGSVVDNDQGKAGGVSALQTKSVGIIGAKPHSPVPTMVDPDGSVDELERRVRGVLEGKMGTDGEILLKLSVPDAKANQGSVVGAIPRAEIKGSEGRKVLRSGVYSDNLEQGARAGSGLRVSGRKWSWEGLTGQSDWGRIDPEFVACSNGRNQAPIKIRKSGVLESSVRPPELHFTSSSVSIGKSNGIFTIDTLGTSRVDFRGETWSLDKIQVYRKTLTVLEDVEADGAFLFIFKGKKSVLYIDVPYRASPNAAINPGLQRVLQRVPLSSDDSPRFSDVDWNPSALIGKLSDEMYFYAGSQPHPPCTEGGFWIALARPIELNHHQITDLWQFVPKGSRSEQPTYDRPILRLSQGRH